MENSIRKFTNTDSSISSYTTKWAIGTERKGNQGRLPNGSITGNNVFVHQKKKYIILSEMLWIFIAKVTQYILTILKKRIAFQILPIQPWIVQWPVYVYFNICTLFYRYTVYDNIKKKIIIIKFRLYITYYYIDSIL